MYHSGINSIDEFKTKFAPLNNVNHQHKTNLTKINKIAVWITSHVVNMGFFAIIFLWTIIWLSWNTLAPIALRFNPFPAFILWLFISNLIHFFNATHYGWSKYLAKHAEIRAEEDFRVNKKSEKEIETILMHLEN